MSDIALSFTVPLEEAGLLGGAGATILEDLAKAATEASLLAEREAKEAVPYSRGTLRDSLAAVPVTIGATTVEAGVGTSLPYAAAVELGTKPHMPPLEPILDWVKRTFDEARPQHYRSLISAEDARKRKVKVGDARRDAADIWANDTANAIRWKIYNKGTKAHFYLEGTLTRNRSQFEAIFSAAVRRFVERMKRK